MKLYIPTCTLNFNNILSSESISPLGFYARRGFGNKRFYPVCANDKEQVIILYSKYPRFEIEENDLENYPMVIEIETDDYKDGFFEKAKEHDGVETYLCYHTINLNPFHCRIYFNSYQERQGVLSKAEQSLENKFYKLYAPNIDVNQAYTWLKESLETEKGGSKGPILHYFLDMSLNKLKADPNHKEQFIQDYLTDSEYADAAIAAEDDAKKKAALQQVKDNLVAMFINSGTADCESLQGIYGPKIEANQSDSTYLKKAISILKMMKCTESEAYFQASYYMYKIDPTADAATGCGYMAYKKGDYDTAIKYFDEALSLEGDNEKKAQIAYAVAATLFNVKKLSQARGYLQKAISFKENYGDAYILLAQLYASSPNWNDEAALNKCTYFVVIDKLQRAKAVDPTVADKANELISTYARYTPKAEDLFMLGIKAGDRVTVGGWIGESTTVR